MSAGISPSSLQCIPGSRTAGSPRPPFLGSPCSALPSSEEDIVIEEFARQKLKGEKDDEDEKEEADKEES